MVVIASVLVVFMVDLSPVEMVLAIEEVCKGVFVEVGDCDCRVGQEESLSVEGHNRGGGRFKILSSPQVPTPRFLYSYKFGVPRLAELRIPIPSTATMYRTRARSLRRRPRVAKRRFKRTRRAKPQTRKSMIKLIRSVSLATAETKRYQAFFAPFANVLPSTGSYYQYIQHFISDLPNVRNSNTPSQSSYIGDSIHLKGVKFRFTMTWDSHESTTPGTAIWIRLSLLSGTNHNDGPVISPVLIGEARLPTQWIEQTSSGLPVTTQRWNTQRVKVHRTKKMVLRPYNEKAGMVQASMYFPFNRKMVSTFEESNLTSNYFNLRANGKQYWFCIELFNAQGGNLTDFGGGPKCEKIIYFKDA